MIDYKSTTTLEKKIKTVQLTPRRNRFGETPTAVALKNMLRPLIRGCYFLSLWIKKYKLASLFILFLLLSSISATTFAMTGELPFGIGRDPFNFPYNGGKGEGNEVKSWLYALRDGNIIQLQLLDKEMSQPPDTAQLVELFSQKHMTWDDTSVISVHQESDGTVDSFVQVKFATHGPGSKEKGILLWHFLTATVNQKSVLLSADLVSARALQT